MIFTVLDVLFIIFAFIIVVLLFRLADYLDWSLRETRLYLKLNELYPDIGEDFIGLIGAYSFCMLRLYQCINPITKARLLIEHQLLLDKVCDSLSELEIDIQDVFIDGLEELIIKERFGYKIDIDVLVLFFEKITSDLDSVGVQ